MGISRGALWETIPAVDVPTRNQAIDLSLERSRDCALRLAATATTNGPPHLIKTIIENASRLRALNVQSRVSGQITSVIVELLQNGAPSQLSELSVFCSPPTYCPPSRIRNYIIEPNAKEQAAFNRLIGSPTVLRLSGIHIHWETTSTAFSDRLVELYIHRVGLGSSNSEMMAFMSALSSARELRDLKIIGAQAYRNPTETFPLAMSSPVMLLKLQSLLLQDLSFNVLEFFLLGIAPGSYHLTLVLSAKVFRVARSDGKLIKIGLDEITGLLALVRIDTLFLPRGPVEDGAWLQGPSLHRLLEAVPKLKVLKMRGWRFYDDLCSGLYPPPNSEQQPHDFSNLEVLHLIKIKIRDKAWFKDMSAALSPPTMVVSGYIKADEKKWVSLSEDEAMVEWLYTNVRGFCLIELKHEVGVLEADSWQLW